MGESQQEKQQQTTTSRLGLRNSTGATLGQIVEVQGGHIVRSTGRKDRHSKVCTAKGPRDRRVRLSAHTAIQFYDVQDRLGYDRPSKAVDWLIKKAKPAIDELAELPPWKPTLENMTSTNNNNVEKKQQLEEEDNYNNASLFDNVAAAGPSSKRAMTSNTASFLPPSLESDSIADTIKSFFPMGSCSTAGGDTSAMHFHHQTFQDPNLLSRTNSQSQDLKLSLQFQDHPIMLHDQNQQPQHHHHNHHREQQGPALFTGGSLTPLGFESSSGWSLHQQAVELGRVQRVGSWNESRDSNAPGGSGGYLFNSPPGPGPPLLQQLFGGQSQFFTERGPLQSSNTPSVRAWMDPTSAIAIASGDHPISHHQAVLPMMYPSSIPGYGFASDVGGFSGFRVPARIQGEEEEHDGTSDKPSSASSDSRH